MNRNNQNNQRISEFERADIPSQRLLPHQKLYITMAVVVLLLFSFVSLQKMHDGFGENLAGFAAAQPSITQGDLTTEFEFLHPGSHPRTGAAVRYGERSYYFRNGRWNIPETPAPARRAPTQRQAARAPPPAAPSAPAEPKLVPLRYGTDPATGEEILFHVDAEGNIYTADKQRTNPVGPAQLLKNTPAYAAAVRQARGESTAPARVTAPPPAGTVPPAASAAAPSTPRQRFDAAHQEYLTAAHEAQQASKKIAELNGRLRAAEEKLETNRVPANLDALNSLKAEYARLMPEFTAQKQQTMARLGQAEAGRTAAEQALRGGAPAPAAASAAAPTPPPASLPHAISQSEFCLIYSARCPSDAVGQTEYTKFRRNPEAYTAEMARGASQPAPLPSGTPVGTFNEPADEGRGAVDFETGTAEGTEREFVGLLPPSVPSNSRQLGESGFYLTPTNTIVSVGGDEVRPAVAEQLRRVYAPQIGGASVEQQAATAGRPAGGVLPPSARGGESVGGEEAARAGRFVPDIERGSIPERESNIPSGPRPATGDKIRVGQRNFIIDSQGNLFFDDPDPAKRQSVPASVAENIQKTTAYQDVVNARIESAELLAQIPEPGVPAPAQRVAAGPVRTVRIGLINGVEVHRGSDGFFYDARGKPITDSAIGRKAAELFQAKRESLLAGERDALALLEEVTPGEQQEFTFEPEELPPAEAVAADEGEAEREPLPPGAAGGERQPAPPRPVNVPRPNTPEEKQNAYRELAKREGVGLLERIPQEGLTDADREALQIVIAEQRAAAARAPGASAPAPAPTQPLPPDTLARLSDADIVALLQTPGVSTDTKLKLQAEIARRGSVTLPIGSAEGATAPAPGAAAAGARPAGTPQGAVGETYPVGGGYGSADEVKQKCEKDHGAGACTPRLRPDGTVIDYRSATPPLVPPRPVTDTTTTPPDCGRRADCTIASTLIGPNARKNKDVVPQTVIVNGVTHEPFFNIATGEWDYCAGDGCSIGPTPTHAGIGGNTQIEVLGEPAAPAPSAPPAAPAPPAKPEEAPLPPPETLADGTVVQKDATGNILSITTPPDPAFGGASVTKTFDQKTKQMSALCQTPTGTVRCGTGFNCKTDGTCAQTAKFLTCDDKGTCAPCAGGIASAACVIRVPKTDDKGQPVKDDQGNPVEETLSAKAFCEKNKDLKNCQDLIADAITQAQAKELSFALVLNQISQARLIVEDLRGACSLLTDKSKCDTIFGDWFNAQEFFTELKKSDPLIGALFTGDWEESVCWNELDRSNAKAGEEGLVFDIDGQLKLWITAERAPMSTPTEEGGLHGQPTFYYRINGEVSPANICDVDEQLPDSPSEADRNRVFGSEFVTFSVWLRGPSGETVIDPDKDESTPDFFKLRCDEGAVTFLSQQTLVRYLPTLYDRVCIKFHAPLNLKEFMRNELDGSMICNTITKSDPEIASGEAPAGGSAGAGVDGSDSIRPAIVN